MNKDKKIDLEEVYRGAVLLTRKEDLDNDGIFDRLTSMFEDPTEPFFKTVETRAFGKNSHRKDSYSLDRIKNIVYVLSQIDTKKSGKWDISYLSHSHKDQHMICAEDHQSSVQNLSRDAISILEGQYHQTDFGYKIDPACLTSNRELFLTATREALSEGMACLGRLQENGGRGAGTNLASLQGLLATNEVKIICSETSYDWGESTLAHATTGVPETDSFSAIPHPSFSINPSRLREFTSGDPDQLQSFKTTVFHEQLHNLSYRHGHDIEYPYACGECCFPSSRALASSTSSACKVCSGNYSGTEDLSYLEDLSIYGNEVYNSSLPRRININYLKEHPADLYGMNLLSYNLSGVFDPIGIALASKIKSEHTLTGMNASMNNMALTYQNLPGNIRYQDSGAIIAQSYYSLYYSGNAEAAIANLRQNIEVLRSSFSRNEQEDNERFVKDSLREGLKNLVSDIWLNGYRGGGVTATELSGNLGIASYELLRDLNLIPPP